MRFLFVIIAAAAMGAVVVFSIPSPALQSMGNSLSHLTLADLNPLQLVYDYDKKVIETPMTPEQLGLHPTDTSQMKFTPMTLQPQQQSTDPMGWNGNPPH
jgi:hypothetical protein